VGQEKPPRQPFPEDENGAARPQRSSYAMVEPRFREVYFQFYKETYRPSAIDRKTKELLIVVACVASNDLVSHVQLHMHAAHKAGASPEEIMAVLDLVGGWIGNVKTIKGLEAWRATFRPDIPTIDRVVELR